MRSLIRSSALAILLAALTACEPSTAPTAAPFGPIAWQLATVNGRAASVYSDAQAYSFRANAGDRFLTKIVATYGLACTASTGAFTLTRDVEAFVDTVAVRPFTPAESPYGGSLIARGTATAIGANTWQLADSITAHRSGDSLVVSFLREGPAVYVYVDAGAIGRQNCGL